VLRVSASGLRSVNTQYSIPVLLVSQRGTQAANVAVFNYEKSSRI